MPRLNLTPFVASCFSLLLSATAIANTTAAKPESTMKSFEVINTVIKQSPNDPRVYQMIRLNNGLDVLLVSDPDLENSAASLSVPVGSMHNPDQQLGLAHYLEHMLFLGSQRYPTINEYSKFMSQHGGYTNAYTSQESTVYGFEVNDEYLGEALDRLADVMRAPLLDEKYAEKERHTVNAENNTYFDNDMRKLYALQRYTLNPDYPMARFSTGDLTTLIDKPGSKLQDELERFFDSYYSANLMKVALTSPRSIADLEQMASSYLSQIPNKNVQKPIILAPMLTEKELAIKVEMKPTADIKLLQVNFLVPSVKDEYMYQPGGYISRLLGSENQGGLSDYLKKAGLVESVMAGFYAPYSDNYSQFTIQFKLTNSGLKAQDTIMAGLFAFIELIKKQGINELQFNEQKKSLETSFEFLTKNAGFNYVMGLSANMQNYPNQDLLFFPYRLDGFNEKFIAQLLTYLTPKNSRLFELTPDAKGGTEIPHYQGEYASHAISEQTQQAWLTQAAGIKLLLPSVNEWTPENLSLIKKQQTEKAVQIVNQLGHSVWFQQSSYLDEPKASFKLQLNSNISDQNAASRVTMSLLLTMLNKQFAELTFVTQEAGLGFSLSSSNGLLIRTSGYSDKQDKLLLNILTEIKNARFSEQSLTLAKQELDRRLNNKSKIKAMDLAMDGFRQVVRIPAWSDATLLAQIDKVSLKDLDLFVKKLFEKSSLRLLALGNLSQQKVLALDAELAKIVAIEAKPFYAIARLHANLKQGPLNYQLSSTLQDDALASIYLTDLQGDKPLAIAELLNKFLAPAFYDQIRTQEQLTYSPFTASFPVNDSVAFGLFTQSPAADNGLLYDRFAVFIENFSQLLNTTTAEKFSAIKDAHIANYLAKPTSLAKEFSYLSNEWLNVRKEINNKQAYIQCLRETSLQEIQTFYQQIFIEGKNRQEIIIQVQGEKFITSPRLTLEGEVKIMDVDLLPK
ncbi:MAG: protease-3 [Psychromonas sp.]|jgi:protease-3|uniref:insulinase family protein n=1 Tax=Psychromonas sp. TaxID=1884585 RepID=UPI0039E3F10B